MELTELVPTERVIDIVHPKTGEEIGLKITLMSLEDERLQRVKRKMIDEKLRLESKGKQMKSEEIAEFDIALIHAAILSWEWGTNPKTGEECTFKGEKPSLSLKNVREVMNTIYWVKEQVLTALNEGESFLPD